MDFRIDNSALKIHLHLGGPQHIYQANVEKLNLDSVDMFSFVRGIFKHRSTGKDFNKVFGFRII